MDVKLEQVAKDTLLVNEVSRDTLTLDRAIYQVGAAIDSICKNSPEAYGSKNNNPLRTREVFVLELHLNIALPILEKYPDSEAFNEQGTKVKRFIGYLPKRYRDVYSHYSPTSK